MFLRQHKLCFRNEAAVSTKNALGCFLKQESVRYKATTQHNTKEK